MIAPATIPRRKSLRLKNYDYAKNGYYFVTVCTHFKRSIFGKITAGEMHLNSLGNLIKLEWKSLPTNFKYLFLDSWVVMPNHMHGILRIHLPYPKDLPLISLGKIIRHFKARSTYLARKEFPNIKLWQPNHFEHVIRSEAALGRIRNYIESNPTRWSLDRENPDHNGVDEFDKWLLS